MKKSQFKSIIKKIITEAVMANIFNLVLYGTQEQRDEVNKEFIRGGGGKLFASFTPIDIGTSSFTIRNTKALQLLESILQRLEWKRHGIKGHKDIIWTAPNWSGVKENKIGEGEVSYTNLPPQTPTDNYETFVKKLKGTGYQVPSKADVAAELKWIPVGRKETWEKLTQRWLDMYDEFARYGTNENLREGDIDWKHVDMLAKKYLAKFEANAVPAGSVSYEEKGAFKDGFNEGYQAAKNGE